MKSKDKGLNGYLILSIESRSKSWGSDAQDFILGYFRLKTPGKMTILNPCHFCLNLSIKNLPHSNELIHPGRRVLLVQAESGFGSSKDFKNIGLNHDEV